MKKYLVADGGGTKTRYMVVDGMGQTLCALTGPGTNPVHIGLKAAKASLVENIRALLEQNNIREDEISGAALFVPVLWRHCTDLSEEFSFPCQILSDTEEAVWAALKHWNGLVILSGTGSFVRGKRDGEELLVGGWGSAFGDEGSGYALGIGTLRRVTHAYDFDMADDELSLGVKAFYKTDDIAALKAMQKNPDMLKAGNVAALCPVLEKAAKKGCPSALEVVGVQARALAEQALNCARRLGFSSDEALKIALTGGVLTNNEVIRGIYVGVLREYFPAADIFLSEREPVYGAIDYVLAMYGRG